MTITVTLSNMCVLVSVNNTKYQKVFLLDGIPSAALSARRSVINNFWVPSNHKPKASSGQRVINIRHEYRLHVFFVKSLMTNLLLSQSVGYKQVPQTKISSILQREVFWQFTRINLTKRCFIMIKQISELLIQIFTNLKNNL